MTTDNGTKSHQNKFHVEALHNLTTKFASMHRDDMVSAADRDLWEYFSTLYKNSNKGIKGRGKDRRILATSKALGFKLGTSNGRLSDSTGTDEQADNLDMESKENKYN